MHFQDVILTLERYWGARGCVLLQPHDLMMGAGTFHPATVLRSLGPGPWKCAFVQPCRRPGDARYGNNPNRLGHYYQYQVVLKPSPPDVQDLYLGSLEALGIDLRANDVRFVEDDWESPTLGAWGLGWEVWLNGLEVTQFTYFQQVGGIGCMPVPAELTYGLERLCMALQGVDDVYDLTWVDGVRYRDVFHRNEVEQSKYNFEHSDAAALFEEFNRSFAECERLAELGLSLPAYDQAIRTSHSFNLLDARGAISVAERANYIRRIRTLACRCAEVWNEQVAQHESPAPALVVPGAPAPVATTATGGRELFVEVQCEELPASYVRPALAALAQGVEGLLEGIDHGEVETYATPRRLAVAIADTAPGRPQERKTVTGPPADRAYDADGLPTKAAMGFARGKGVDPSALTLVDTPRGKVVAVEVVEGGESTTDVVAAGLDAIVRQLPFPKSMEWGTGGVRWARPIARINALYDGVRIEGAAAGLPLGDQTTAHRLSDDATFSFVDGRSWAAGLRKRGVEPDLDARCAQIRGMLLDAREQLDCDPIVDDELLEEVLHLVEAPALVIGTFRRDLLDLPPRLLVQTMKQNQRYFPVFRNGELDNHFVVISNNPWGEAEPIAKGNAAVLLARFDDARFFTAEDKKRRLEVFGDELTKMRWIRGLGTMAHKQERIARLAEALANRVGARPELAFRAGSLCKADLVTLMVGEFPKLQGHMGKLYADAQGEDPAVGRAIEQAWQPRYADDEVPRDPEGIAVALADRLDTLVGCFGIGLVPKGGDPQGLRRAALGILRTLVEHGLRMDLRALLTEAVVSFHESVVVSPDGFEAWTKARGAQAAPTDRDALVEELEQFCLARFKAQATSSGVTADLVDAVLEVSPPDAVLLQRKVDALAALTGHQDFGAIMTTFKRVLNITRGHDYPSPSPADLGHDAERSLHEATEAVEGEIESAAAALDFPLALSHTLTLRAPVADLFDAVMVDAPDPGEKAVRMGLLLRVARSFLAVADFSRISTR